MVAKTLFLFRICSKKWKIGLILAVYRSYLTVGLKLGVRANLIT